MGNKKDSPALGGGAAKGADNTLGNKTSIAFSDDSVNVFQSALQKLTDETHGLTHGIVTLQIHIREGSPYRYVVSREISFLCGGGE